MAVIINGDIISKQTSSFEISGKLGDLLFQRISLK